MPLLNKHTFEPKPVPDGITSSTRVFHCKPTNEVFLTHEEYFNRLVLLNSTTWSCSLTRKTNLTYFEAIASEEEASRELCDFPLHLELPILFIVHKFTNRGRFEELVNDVYHIMKERYFNNEEVTYSERSRKYCARVIKSNMSLHARENVTVENAAEIKDPVLPTADSYRYTIEILEQNGTLEERYRENISFDRLFRSKNVGARQKIRLFLKNACHLLPDIDRYTIKDSYLSKVEHMWWTDVMTGPEPICPQTPVQQRGRIPNTMKPGYVEPEKKERKPKKEERDPSRPRGRPPKTAEEKARFQEEKRKRQVAGRDAPPQPDDFDLTSSGALTLSVPSTSTPAAKKPRKSNAMNNEKKQAKIREQQGDLDFYFSEAKRLGINVAGLEQEDKLLSPKKVAEFKQKVKEEKEVERENLKEEKKRKIKEKAAYNKKREDLICNDLKPMPRFPKLEIPEWMSNEEFGDYIFITQFFRSFKEILPLKEIRGNDEILFADIVLAVKCNDPQNSPFADLMRVLLSIRTDIADEEDGDEADINNRDEVYLINTQNCDPANITHGDSIRDISDLHSRIRKIHGKSVRHLPVDWMTLTEVLRLIFETSGYYTGIATHRHRLYSRGNFRGYEDPAFELRNSRPDIMAKLRTQSVFDLEPDERLEIIKVIIYQLLTYSKFRGHLEKYQNELIELKKEQKKLKTWDSGQEAEANAARILLESDANGTPVENGSATKESSIVKKFKAHIKAHNEGRRFDKDDMDSILLDSVPYTGLSLDEIVTARELQRVEYQQLMDSLIVKSFDIYCKVSDIRLGHDRAHRRFIVLESLSAILVEFPTASELGISCEEASNIDDPQNLVENELQEVFYCSGNEETCTVHGPNRNNHSRWCYVKNAQQLEDLVKSLNPRGNRESELAEELNEFRPSLLKILHETERLQDEDEWKEILMTDESDPAETYNIDWDAEMRDLLLDFEEKIDQGQLGSIEKVFSVPRNSWRENLKNLGDVCMLLNDNITLLNETVVDLDETMNSSDVKKLAIAFLMIIRSINLKFIKAPFLSPNKDEHGNLKAAELFIRWQKALVQCESLSALSLFISTFEGSIKWDKSRLQGKCHSCRRKGAVHELVLCSECDTCFHLKCVKLSTEKEAPTDWMCTICRAQQRKLENEAKRMKRDDKIGETEDDIANMSIDENVKTDSDWQNGEGPSTSTPTAPTMRTASGRAVKRVQYSEIHEGLSLKNRKSNGSTAIPSAPVTPSERPVRNVAVRILDNAHINDLSDDDESDMEDQRRRKSSTKKQPMPPEISRAIPPNVKEKMSAIESLLKETMRQECSWPFLQPVDAKEVPDYYDVIKRPMDLRTMMNKIKQRIYNKPDEIRNDFQLILTNCETYNETESEIYQCSQELCHFVSSRLDAIIEK